MSNRGVLLFGRMNPPTIGHLAALERLNTLATENNATPALYLSQSQGDPKNPLTFQDKCRIIETVTSLPIRNKNSDVRNPVQAAVDLNTTFDELLIMGDDAVQRIDWQKYNGDLYRYNSITVTDTGERNEHSTDPVHAASATLARRYASLGDRASFDRIVATNPSELWSLVRHGLNL